MSIIQKGKFLEHKCKLTGKPCIFISMGEFAQCGLCRIAEEHAPLSGAVKIRSGSVKRHGLVKK